MGMGAIGAMVFLPIAYQPADASSLSSLVAGIAGFGGGSLLGLLGGGLVIRIQRFQNRIPEGLEHALPLALVFLLFQFSNQWMPGSGIAAATVAGVVAGRKNGPGLPSLLPFREPLMVSLSSVMIVVVAAEIRLTEVRELGWPGVFLVMALVLILRPASLFVSTRSSDLRGKEKIMLSGLGPRGLLAAAGAALFASMAEHSGASEGNLFQALVFGILVVTGALASGIGDRLRPTLGTSARWKLRVADPGSQFPRNGSGADPENKRRRSGVYRVGLRTFPAGGRPRCPGSLWQWTGGANPETSGDSDPGRRSGTHGK